MRKIPIEEFTSRIKPLVTEKLPSAANDPKFSEKAALIQERITFFPEAPDMLAYFYEEPTASLELIANPKQKIEKEDVPKILEFLKKTLESVDEKSWSIEKVKEALEKEIPSSGFKKGQILWPLRAILTGREYSPGAYEVAGLLGKDAVIRRLHSVASAA